MDGSRIAGVSTPRLPVRRPGLVTIAVAALVAIGFFVNTALPYLLQDPRVMARYEPRRWWLLMHVTAGSVALLTGPVQLWLGISGRAMRARGAVRPHRWLGLVYVGAVAIGALAAFKLAANTTLGWVFGFGITGLGVAWLATTTRAVVAIRRGLVELHRDWMIRSYVVTFAFVTFRVLWTILAAAGIGSLPEQLAAASWFCWAVPLLAPEIVLQGRRMSGHARATADVPLAYATLQRDTSA